LAGAVNNDTLTLNNPKAGLFVSAGTAANAQSAGLGKDIRVTGLELTATQAGKPVYGYTFVSTITGNVGEISAKVLDVAFTKVYEGNTQFDNADGYTLTKMVAGEAAPKISSGSITVSSPNADTYNKFSTTTLSLDNPNYTLLGGAQLATIQPAPLGIAIKTLFKAKTELPDIAAKDFTVVGLQNGETIPSIDLLTLFSKDVSKNDENYVKAIAVSAGPGVANVANYVIKQAVNPTEGSNTMNMVKLISPDEVVTMPSAPPPALPAVTAAAPAAPTPTASVSTAPAAATTSAAATPSTNAAAAPAAAATTTTAAATTTSTASTAAPEATTTTAAPAAATATASPAASTDVAASTQAPAPAMQAVVASNVTPGVVVSTVRASTPQASGLVTVELPKDMVNLSITPIVIPLPTAVVATTTVATGATAGLNVTLSNNQPLPDWIRYDANQKALITTPDARATFPITVVIVVGDQRTVVVVSEKPRP
jgi:hypothetical protein